MGGRFEIAYTFDALNTAKNLKLVYIIEPGRK